ncbi:MAG: NAD(P)/FAD-dependent oxidoreductase, partial [Planctomycetota bacterium]
MVVGELTEETDVLVVGGGPGGYVAAFKAADLGLNTTLVDANAQLGGVCLREGCIPSKALLHIAHLIEDAKAAAEHGVTFSKPKIDIDKLRSWKQSVVDRLCGGINTLAKKRNVRVITGRALFEDSRTARIEGGDVARIKFKHAIIATGSSARALPEAIMPADCFIDAAGALELERIPKTMAVIGGGYIGLELGQVYAALGSKVTVIEMLDQILPGADPDLARPLTARLKAQFEAIHTGAALERAKRTGKSIELSFKKNGNTEQLKVECVLVSIGRRPNSDGIGLENTKVRCDDAGFIEVDAQLRTADKRIWAIGDVVGGAMLAHKASHEGLTAAEVIAGHNVAFDKRAIPAVVYTSPELAWCGLT